MYDKGRYSVLGVGCGGTVWPVLRLVCDFSTDASLQRGAGRIPGNVGGVRISTIQTAPKLNCQCLHASRAGSPRPSARVSGRNDSR